MKKSTLIISIIVAIIILVAIFLYFKPFTDNNLMEEDGFGDFSCEEDIDCTVFASENGIQTLCLGPWVCINQECLVNCIE